MNDLYVPIEVERELLLREAATAEARGHILRAHILRCIAHGLWNETHRPRFQQPQREEEPTSPRDSTSSGPWSGNEAMTGARRPRY